MKKLILPVFLLIVALATIAHSQVFKSETTRKAGALLNKGDRAGAIAVLDAAIARNKDVLEAYQMRGNLRSVTGDFAAAISDYSAALEIDPTNALIYERRATFRRFLRDYSGALKDYDSAIANGAKSENIYAGRAGIKADLDDFDGAIADYQNAIAANPNSAKAYLGQASLFERKGNINSAIASLQGFINNYEGARDGKLPKLKSQEPTGESVSVKRSEKGDGSQEFLIGSGVVTQNSAGTVEDIEKLQAKMEQSLNVPLAYFNLGRLYAKNNEIDNALVNYEKGLTITKNDPYGHKLRSEAHIKKGDLPGAIEDLGFVEKSGTPFPDAHADIGILNLLRRNDAQAEKEFELYLQTFPKGKPYLDKRIEEARKLLSNSPDH